MGKIRELSINLGSPTNVFYAGEELKGYVTVCYDRERWIKSLKLRIFGDINCVWTDLATEASEPDLAMLIAYTSSECLIDSTISIIKTSEENDNDSHLHPAGKQLYDFLYELPPNLPSSFEGAHGTIRYYAKATIEEASGEVFHTKIAFTVLSVIDVNDKSLLRQPGGEITNGGKIFCCSSGRIYFRAYLDRAAYCPGESIYVSLHIENTSQKPIPSISIHLEKQETYKAESCHPDFSNQQDERINKSFVVSIRTKGVLAKEGLDIDDHAIAIPATEPSIKATLINVEYFIHVLLKVHKNANLRLIIPVLIGTIPFRGLRKKQGSRISVKSQGPPWDYLPIQGAKEMRIKDDGDGEYVFITENYVPLYPYAT